MKNRNIILGIDGVPYELIDSLTKMGYMPNFGQLRKDFTFKVLRSSIPHISSVSWSTIITGKNPGEHGIYGFNEIIENTYSMRFPNFNALKSKPFWQEKTEEKHILLNVPSTYPAKKLNGIHIAGFVALDLENAVYPKNFIPELKELGYEIDIDTKLAHQQTTDIFLNELFRVLNIRKKTIEHLWNKFNWKNFFVVITGSDRIGHFLWHIYEDKSNPYHQRFLEYFRRIDDIIGEILSKINENDTLIVLSDHGMERIEQNVNLNTYLESEKYLFLSKQFRKYNRILEGSKAFVLDPGRVYLNRINHFPNGTIKENNEKELIEELKTLFYDLKFKNRKVIKKVYEKNEVYSGKMIKNAPDLVLIENKGFNLNGSIGKEDIFEKENKFSGKHNENSFILINKCVDLKEPSVQDVIGLFG